MRLNRLNLSIDTRSINNNIQTQTNRMRNDGVHFVHGSDINALLGVARHGSILSANDRDHYGVTAQSGERGYTLSADRSQPIRQGVSMYSVENYDQSQHYTRLGSGTPIMFGMKSNTPLASSRLDHPVSRGSIPHSNIAKIYVPEGQLHAVRDALMSSGGAFASTLVGKLKENDGAFN